MRPLIKVLLAVAVLVTGMAFTPEADAWPFRRGRIVIRNNPIFGFPRVVQTGPLGLRRRVIAVNAGGFSPFIVNRGFVNRDLILAQDLLGQQLLANSLRQQVFFARQPVLFNGVVPQQAFFSNGFGVNVVAPGVRLNIGGGGFNRCGAFFY